MRAFPELIDKEQRDLSIWEGILDRTTPDYKVSYVFIFKNVEIYDLQYIFDGNPSKLYRQASNIILDSLSRTSIQSLLKMIDSTTNEACCSESIPMFSNLDDAYITELSILSKSNETFESIGAKLPGCESPNSSAMYKYGETHSKLLALLDLVWILDDHPYSVTISPLGQEFRKRTIHERGDIFSKLLLRIPVIRNICRNKAYDLKSVKNEVSLWVNNTTIDRRSSSIMRLLNEITENYNDLNDDLEG